jgi:hypothetical protein
MTNTVLIKRSAVANAVPGPSSLLAGELAINYADGNLFYKNSGNTVTVIASNKFSSVSGNVTAAGFTYSNGYPVSSAITSTVDNFDGTGAQVAFVLSTSPSNENFTWVNIDGVEQLRTGYNLSGNTITFSSAPAASAVIEVTSLGGSAFGTQGITGTQGTQGTGRERGRQGCGRKDPAPV